MKRYAVVVPIPIVAIQVEQPPEASDWVRQMVSACTSGVAPSRCADANDADAAKAEHLAYVSWLDEAQKLALVEVGTPDEPRGEWRFQRLRFTSEDPELDRWRSIGLTVATLVGPKQAEAVTPDRISPEAPQPQPPLEEQSEPSRLLWLAVRGVVGTGFEHGDLAPGIDLRAAYALETVPVFSVLTVGSRAASRGSVAGSWWDFAVGLGARVQSHGVRLSAASLMVAQSLRVSAEAAGAEDSGSSATLGGGVLLELTWPSDGRVGFTLGGRGVWLRRPTAVSVANQPSALSPQRSYTGFAGLEARF